MMEDSRINKFQHQFWVTKEALHRKLGKKEEDQGLVASDATLDAKLELFKSIQQTSLAMNKLLDRYQERICLLAQEQNTMGRFLKEFGKADRTNAGKMMMQMGKSLIYTSQQEIGLRPPLLRLYQEVETFRHRAVEDTLSTIRQMEKSRTEYRASLKWMKNVSTELDPDTFKQLDKFRKVQTHVRRSKGQFDKLKLACLQKVDLLAAARCNMFSHALIHYQTSSLKTALKISEIFRTLANTFKGYQHFDFCFIKELAEPSRNAAKASGAAENYDSSFDPEKMSTAPSPCNEGEKQLEDEDLLDISQDIMSNGGQGDHSSIDSERKSVHPQGFTQDDLRSNERLLENLLGYPLDQSPETEMASEALDLSLAWPSQFPCDRNATDPTNKGKKEKEDSELLAEEFGNIPFEGDTADTMSLLNELLTATGPLLLSQQPLIPQKSNTGNDDSTKSRIVPLPSSIGSLNPSKSPSSYLPSHLLDFGKILDEPADLLKLSPIPGSKETKLGKGAKIPITLPKPTESSWYDIFADLDPISNPDAIGLKKEEQTEENRYC